MRPLLEFVGKQFICSLFPIFIFAASWFTLVVPMPIPRYDVLLIACLGFQAWLVWTGLETREELRFISIFHVAGLILELYKVHHGSWQYPGFAYSKIGDVPLFSGFMYASITSYMVQAWRRFDLAFKGMPHWGWSAAVGAAIYLNFFSGRLIGDKRLWIVAAVLAIFGNTWVTYRPDFAGKLVWRMPMVVAFVLIGFFVWCAEHLCTWLHVWAYPHQVMGWQPVTISKLGSWCLLVVVSFLLVGWTKKIFARASTNDCALAPAIAVDRASIS